MKNKENLLEERSKLTSDIQNMRYIINNFTDHKIKELHYWVKYIEESIKYAKQRIQEIDKELGI